MLEANLELVEQRRLDGRVEIYPGQPRVVLVIPGHRESGIDGRRTGVILVLVLNHDTEVIARVDVVIHFKCELIQVRIRRAGPWVTSLIQAIPDGEVIRE